MRNRPILRIDAEFDLQQVISKPVVKALQEMDYPFQSCITCEHFDEKNENCKIVNQRPPARVIVFGCDSWYNKDEIPF